MEAIQLPREIFGNIQLLINAYMESFINLLKLKSMNQVAELRVIYDQLETTVRNLKPLGAEPHTYGSCSVPMLTKKLLIDLRMIISRTFKNEVWMLQDVLTIFKEELEVKERCMFSASTTSKSEGDISTYSTVNLLQQQQKQI